MDVVKPCARFAFALVEYCQAAPHILAELVELVLQTLHDIGAVLVGAAGEFVGLCLCLVEDSTRFLLRDIGDVVLPGEELRLLEHTLKFVPFCGTFRWEK